VDKNKCIEVEGDKCRFGNKLAWNLWKCMKLFRSSDLTFLFYSGEILRSKWWNDFSKG
jgi:hypothetical protein